MSDRIVLPEPSVGVEAVEVISLTRSASHPLLAATRPRQWTKNLLVIAAPGAAGILGQASVIGHVAIAFVALTMCASATYLVNDIVDARWDASHPTKRWRPVASGHLSTRAASTAPAAKPGQA